MSRHNWMILWLLQSYTFPVMFLALWSHSWSNFRLISWWFRYYSLELKTITRLFEIIMQPKSLNPADLPANLRKSISLTKRNYYLLTKLTNRFSVNFVVNREAILSNHIFLYKGIHKRCPGVCHCDVVKIIWEEFIRIL